MYFTLDWLLYYTDRKDVVEPLYKKYKELRTAKELNVKAIGKVKENILVYSERSWRDIIL